MSAASFWRRAPTVRPIRRRRSSLRSISGSGPPACASFLTRSSLHWCRKPVPIAAAVPTITVPPAAPPASISTSAAPASAAEPNSSRCIPCLSMPTDPFDRHCCTISAVAEANGRKLSQRALRTGGMLSTQRSPAWSVATWPYTSASGAQRKLAVHCCARRASDPKGIRTPVFRMRT